MEYMEQKMDELIEAGLHIEADLQITSEDTSQEKTLSVPKPLAYYLGTHFCGSNVMHELIEEDTRRDIKQAIVTALGL